MSCAFETEWVGETAAPPLASGLADALRLAKYELGVTIELRATGPYSVEGIAPGSAPRFPDEHAFAGLNGRISRGAVVLGTIEYPPAARLDKFPCAADVDPNTGILIYAKAVLTAHCPPWLLTYAAAKDNVFPHDPTSDQWFDEARFAAYTELGRIVAQEARQCIELLRWLDQTRAVQSTLGG